jgi:hypothetical protein
MDFVRFVVVLLLFVLTSFGVSALLFNAEVAPVISTFTTAVCEGRTCQDVLVTCEAGRLTDTVFVSGMITFSELWTDPRSTVRGIDSCDNFPR